MWLQMSCIQKTIRKIQKMYISNLFSFYLFVKRLNSYSFYVYSNITRENVEKFKSTILNIFQMFSIYQNTYNIYLTCQSH